LLALALLAAATAAVAAIAATAAAAGCCFRFCATKPNIIIINPIHTQSVAALHKGK
jgi:hypothetical protein